jgi:hypothetical protein
VSGRPERIAVLGNCHAGVLRNVIGHAWGADVVEAKFFKVTQPLTEDAPAWIEAADLILVQANDCGAPKLPGPVQGRVVPFPLLTAQFLWPFNVRSHKRNEDARTVAMPEGLFNHVMMDAQLLRIIEDREIAPDAGQDAVDEAVQAYLDLDYAGMINLDRMLELARAAARKSADVVGYDVFSVVERDFRSKPVFVTRLHPQMYVLEELCVELLPRAGLPITRGQVQAALRDIYDDEEIFVYGAPIHPSVLRHFGISWPGEPPRFRFNCDGWVTARQMAERTIRFDVRQPATELFNRINLGEPVDKVRPLLEQLARDDPGNATLRIRLADLLLRLGAQDEAIEHYVAAAKHEPDQPGLVRKLTKALQSLGFGRDMPPIQAGAWQSLTPGSAAAACLQQGWREPESWGCWMQGYVATMVVPTQSSELRGSVLKFDARAFPAFHGRSVAVTVYANGRLTGRWFFDPTRPCGERTLSLPDPPPSSPLRLHFFIDGVATPLELGVSADPRTFSLGLAGFCIEARGADGGTFAKRRVNTDG